MNSASAVEQGFSSQPGDASLGADCKDFSLPLTTLKGPNGIALMTQHRDRDGFKATSFRPVRRLIWMSGAGLLASLSVASAEESRLLKLPSIFRKAEQPAAQPQPKTESRTASDDRVLNRARQLLSEARKEDAQGRLENALDLAARADGVYRAAQRTTDARWPSSEQTPADYVRQLEGKLLARAAQQTANTPAAAVTVGMLPGQPKNISKNQQLANAAVNTLATSGEFGKTQRPDEAAANLTPAKEQLRHEFLPTPTRALENLTTKGREVLDVATTAKDFADVLLEPTPSPEPNPHQPLSTAPAQIEPTKVERSLQTARTVLDRLDQMQHWQPVNAEKPANNKSSDPTDPPLPDRDDAKSRGAQTPVLLGTPSGIADDQVNPIPTQLQNDRLVETGPTPIEIHHPSTPSELPATLPGLPGLPLSTTKSVTRPDPLLMPALGGAEKDEEPAPTSKATTHPLWLVGTVQALATFIGALSALLVVLALRPKAKATVPQAVASNSTVPQVAVAPKPVLETSEVTHDATHHEPTTIPFRRVDAADKDSTKVATPLTHEAAAKSVFEQNLQLLDELNHLSEKKAA